MPFAAALGPCVAGQSVALSSGRWAGAVGRPRLGSVCPGRWLGPAAGQRRRLSDRGPVWLWERPWGGEDWERGLLAGGRAGGPAAHQRAAGFSVVPQEVLQNLYRTKSFLFVGCGETLRDQIFQALFLYSVPNRADLEHYMVLLKEGEDQFFKHQADMLLHGIKVVSYGASFDLFPGYVQDLASRICRRRSPGTGPVRVRCAPPSLSETQFAYHQRKVRSQCT